MDKSGLTFRRTILAPIYTTSSFHWLTKLIILLAIFWLAPDAAAQQQVGFVLESHGKWFLEGSRSQLTSGSALPARGIIYVQSPAEDDYIVVVNLRSDVIARRSCLNAGDCSRPIRLPSATTYEPSAWDLIMESVFEILKGNPDRYSIHRKRDENLPSDGVVQLKDGQIGLGPILQQKARGRYHLRLRVVPRSGKPTSGSWIGPFHVDWDPQQPEIISSPDFKPGLYELTFLEPVGEVYMPVGTSAWILVSEAAEYNKTASSYGEAVALTHKWGAKVTPGGAQSFLRAYLDRLAIQMAK
jgi:hypothetical protein